MLRVVNLLGWLAIAGMYPVEPRGECVMKKFQLIGLFGLAIVFMGAVQSAHALPKFKIAFEKRYTEENSNEEFRAAVKKEACNVCHVKGVTSKKERNVYGEALSKLIPGEAQQRLKDASDRQVEEEVILKELEEAFGKVENQKVDEDKADSPTFGDLLKAGSLPGVE